MNKISGFLLAVLAMLIISCSQVGAGRVLILNYPEFGPQAMAYETIGYRWWQWQSTGSDDPKTSFDIRVVVYKDMTKESVSKRYPVSESKRQDYRYLEYKEAISYLDTNIEEDIVPEVTSLLQKTRQKLIVHFED